MLVSQEECILLLEKIRWRGQPRCPYCDSKKFSRLKQESRYHCNECFTSYSVTVGTLFQGTHVKLFKWFHAIQIVMNHTHKVTVRQLAIEIDVNKNTALYMLNRINNAIRENPEFINSLLEEIRNFIL